MWRSTAPSVWNAVEIAIRGENRSIPHARTASGSSPSNSTLSSPASRSSSSSMDMCLPSDELGELAVGFGVAPRAEAVGVGAFVDPTGDERDDHVVKLLGRDAPEDGTRDRGRPVEAAA